MLDFYLILLIAAALLGAILGSFLNALLYRYNTGSSVLRGRSRCMRCGHTLTALDLVPVLSYAYLRGKCRYCGARISPQYPLVELAGAVLALGIALQYPPLGPGAEPLWFCYWLLVWMTLLFIFVYDLRHKIIPWSASGLLLVLAFGHVWSFGFDVWSFAAGPLLAAPLFLFSAASGGRWMGWGDAPLQLSLGWLLGLWAGLSGLALAFWSGALVGIALMLRENGYTMKSELPFAPFLIAGAAAAYFFHVDIFSSIAILLG